MPNFGSTTPTKRLGDILQSGKGYVANQWDGTAEYQELYLYHLLGDPSGQMWSNDPVDIDATEPARIQLSVSDRGSRRRRRGVPRGPDSDGTGRWQGPHSAS